jgi:hypothetical protein
MCHYFFLRMSETSDNPQDDVSPNGGSNYTLYCRLVARGVLTSGMWVVIQNGIHKTFDTRDAARHYAERVWSKDTPTFMTQVDTFDPMCTGAMLAPHFVLSSVVNKDDATAIREMQAQCNTYWHHMKETKTRMMNYCSILHDEMDRRGHAIRVDPLLVDD